MHLYLDFESNVAGDLFIAGELVDGEFRQVVLDPRLEGLAHHHAMPLMTPGDYVERLFSRLEARGGTLVAYSTAEAKTITRVATKLNIRLPNVSYCNMAKGAKTWINRCHRSKLDALPPLVLGADAYTQRRQIWSLASIMRLTQYPAPADYGIGHTTSRINSVLQGLRIRNGEYANMTRVQKAKATKFLKHNRFDVKALEYLQGTIASEAPQALERGTKLLSDVAT